MSAAEALAALPPLREVIARHGLAPRKALGQNFLLDLNLTGRIARAAGDLSDCEVVEVGPGPGGLTRALLAAGARRVVAVETDARCLAALAEIAEACPGRLRVVEADALKLDLSRLVEGPAKIVANLPYNIATPLVTGWLEHQTWPPWYASMTLMFQREVAERLVAPPGGKSYGRLSVLTAWRAHAAIAFDVNRAAFTPPPKVTSSVVSLTPRAAPEPCEPGALRAVAAAAFGQRRKMLRQSLKALGEPMALLEAAELDPQARAETLSVADFARLARAWSAARQSAS